MFRSIQPKYMLRLTTMHISSSSTVVAVAEAAAEATTTVCNRTAIMAGVVVDKKFPVDFLVPKHETGVIQFLKKYPAYNGDGVTIAILDSGVDPKASGLETTPDGSVKVIERFDCSGCGDVDTTKKVSPSPDGIIVGLSGRNIKISDAIKKEMIGLEYRIGLKSFHDLYPAKVNEKINADTKFKIWDPKHKIAVAETSKRLSDFEAANSSNSNLSLTDKLVKEDIEYTLEYLQMLDKQYTDVKTFYDILLYQTNNGWRCAIDIALDGNLEKAISLGEYSKTHEIKSIDDFLSVSMNVHDDGNVLEIVGMCSSHGTHVASIASGNHKSSGSEYLDGVAPGAKIVSLTIGDGRLGSMETGTAIVRALMKIMELCNAGRRVHLINMSYGEFTHWSTSGRIGEIMNEIVNDYGVVWVASAGNHGPALCTIGTPPDISQPACIGVGAYVSPEMMEAEYTLREKLPGNVYTWTSRDPCIDGGEGVTVCAPGAAIASVPQFTLNNQQLMNGTSMSAPHVCGAIALLISGLLKNKIDYSPYSIKRAIWNTATRLQHVDKFAQGNGLLNVEAAYDSLVKYHDRSERDIRFSISVGSENAKGIHMRRGVLNKPEEFNVTIQPVFMKDKNYASKAKIEFNKRLTLIPSEPWIQCGSFLDLCYSPRSIVVKIDPTGLPAGVHTGKIRAYECDDVEKGTMFEIPVTVVQPIVLQPNSNWQYSFEEVVCKPNTILRHFILVPNNASWAVVRLRSNDKIKSTQAKFLVHTMQIIPLKYCKTYDTQKILPVSSENDTLHHFRVEQNNILEVCIAKYWSNFGTTTLNASIEFHGVRSSLSNTMIHNASGVQRIDLTSLNREELVLSIQLKNAILVLKPTESKISPLTSRDILPHGRQIYQNLLTYVLNLTKPQEVSFSLPLLNNVLYESDFESQLYMCFDANRRLLICGDAYSGNNFFKLSKGEYTIKVQIRHEKKDLLEKVNEATLTVSFKLGSALNLDIYNSYRAALLGEKKVSSLTVSALQPVPFYIAPLTSEKLTKAGIISQCAWLQGVLSTSKDETARKIDQITFDYILPDGPAVAKKNGASKSKDVKIKYDDYLEGLRDYQNGQIAKLELADAEKVYESIVKDFPTYLTAHVTLMQKLEVTETKNSLPLTFKLSIDNTQDLDTTLSTLKRIVNLADIVINGTNVDTLLAYYGLKSDTRPDAAKIKTDMDKQKANLLDAYVRKVIALGKINIIDAKQSEIDSSIKITPVADDIDAIFTEVGKFTDYYDQKILILTLWHAYTKQQYGRMWKVLQKMNEDKQQREFLEEMQLVAHAKNWSHVADILQKVTISAHPVNYRLF